MAGLEPIDACWLGVYYGRAGEAKDYAGALKELCVPKIRMNKNEFKIHLSNIKNKYKDRESNAP